MRGGGLGYRFRRGRIARTELANTLRLLEALTIDDADLQPNAILSSVYKKIKKYAPHPCRGLK